MWMLRTLNGLRKRGHNVHLICRPDTELEKRAIEQAIPVYSFKIRGDFGPISIFRTWRYIKRNNIDVMLANMDKELRFAGTAAKLAGNCAVIPRRGSDYPLKDKIQYKFSYLTLADLVIANSDATKQTLLRNAPWLPAKKINILYNGIDPQNFMTPAETDLRMEWNIPRDEFVFGFVGQLVKRKGFDTILPAFAELARDRQVHLVLVGEGELQQDIDDFIKLNGLENKLHRVGFRKDVENVMKAIDCLLLPSILEGFGIVLIEAMAAGKPAITTNVSSMPEIVVHNQTGLVLPVNDKDALLEGMKYLYDNPDIVKQWGENGRNHVLNKFTLDLMLDRLEHLIKLAMDPK